MTTVPAASPIEVLTEAECWEYLRANSLGRFAVVGRDGVDIFPINYTTDDDSLLFRSAPGMKLVDLTANPRVAFEIDGTDQRRRWSVVFRGVARRLDTDSEIEAAQIHKLKTQTPTDKWNYVRISPTSVTGRRFYSRR
jgi:nitroimidazol reductase NimA-like FMN-containing flavoprotein (pyridoxamine 5'-phosphate oxidase superfamily)